MPGTGGSIAEMVRSPGGTLRPAASFAAASFASPSLVRSPLIAKAEAGIALKKEQREVSGWPSVVPYLILSLSLSLSLSLFARSPPTLPQNPNPTQIYRILSYPIISYPIIIHRSAAASPQASRATLARPCARRTAVTSPATAAATEGATARPLATTDRRTSKRSRPAASTSSSTPSPRLPVNHSRVNVQKASLRANSTQTPRKERQNHKIVFRQQQKKQNKETIQTIVFIGLRLDLVVYSP